MISPSTIELSICIAAYNLQAYLSRCLNSIENAAKNFPHQVEVLIINDGSTDSTGSIAQKYCQKNKNWRVVNKTNGGLSSVRIESFKEAKGKYVWCIDGDDTITKNSVTDILTALKSNDCLATPIDILYLRYLKIYGSNDYLPIHPLQSHSLLNKNISYDVPLNTQSYHELIFSYPGTWSRVIRKDYYYQISTPFTTGIWYEDSDSSPKIDIQSKSFMALKSFCYQYWGTNPGSVTNTIKAEKILDVIKVSESLKQYFKENSLWTQYHNELEYSIIRYILLPKCKLLEEKGYSPEAKTISAYIAKSFPSWLSNSYFKNDSLRERIYYLSIIYGLRQSMLYRFLGNISSICKTFRS